MAICDLRDFLSVSDVVQKTGLGRTFIYNEMKQGRLLRRKFGRRTLIARVDFDAWLSASDREQRPVHSAASWATPARAKRYP